MILGLFSTILAIYHFNKKWGTAIAYSLLIWCGYVYSVTEILSLFHLICTPAVLAVTIVYDLVFLSLVVLKARREKVSLFETIRGLLGVACTKWLFIGLLVLSFLILAFSQVMTIYHPDSLNYHLPRILMWYQNESVAHFATSDTRMIGSPPLKEFVDLWIYSIWGSIHEQMGGLYR